MKFKREVIRGRLVKGLGKVTPGDRIEIPGPLAKALDDLGITRPVRKPKDDAPATEAGGEED